LVHKGSNEDGKLATALPSFSGREHVEMPLTLGRERGGLD
jgi:hypothetical protein